MKKLIITATIVMGLGMTSFADPNGGLFQRGNQPENINNNRDGRFPSLPTHGQDGNQNAPLGSGSAVLIGLGAAYLVGKKHKNQQ